MRNAVLEYFLCFQLDVNTVAAGGGSMLFFRSGLFVVGPESAGAHPGPVCYRKGGYLAVTDANLCLGRILPEYFPQIFGPSENEPLDKAATILAFKNLTSEVCCLLIWCQFFILKYTDSISIGLLFYIIFNKLIIHLFIFLFFLEKNKYKNTLMV